MADDRDRNEKRDDDSEMMAHLRDEDATRAMHDADPLDAIGDAFKSIASIDAEKSSDEKSPVRIRRVAQIDIDKIDAHSSARPIDDACVDRHAAFLRRYGATDPIQVIERPSGRYTIVPGKGRHRLEAHRKLGAKHMAAIVEKGDAELVIDAALASEAMANREIDVWDQYRSVVQWRERHPADTHEEIAEAIGVSVPRVTMILTVRDCVDPELVEEKLSATPERITLSHLLEVSRVGREETPIRRRHAQWAEWERRTRQNWCAPPPRKKRRPRTAQIRMKILHTDPNARLRGATLRKVLAWVLAEPLEVAIEKAEAEEMKPKRKYAPRSWGAQVLKALK